MYKGGWWRGRVGGGGRHECMGACVCLCWRLVGVGAVCVSKRSRNTKRVWYAIIKAYL